MELIECGSIKRGRKNETYSFRLNNSDFLHYFFVSPSLAIIKEIENRELPENYTAILIQLPGIFHQPTIWNEKYTMVSILKLSITKFFKW
jgi:hypothetical protein